MTARLVIVGAGGFGREVQSWIETSPKWLHEHGNAPIVFVDDAAPPVPVRAPIVSRLEGFVPEVDDLVLVAIGAPLVRRSVVSRLRDHGAQFTSFVHDNAVIGDGVTVGAGSIICPGSILSTDIVLGEQVHINTNCMIGHDVSLGSFSTLSTSCNLGGGVVVGENTFVATGTSVIPGRKVGMGAYVGVGSVVIRHVPDGVTVFGNPSKVIGRRKS